MAYYDYDRHLGWLLLDEDLRTLQLFSRHINQLRNDSNGRRILEQQCLLSTENKALVEVGEKDEISDSLLLYFYGCPEDQNSLGVAKNYLLSLKKKHLVPIDKVDWLVSDEQACLFFFLSIASEYPSPTLRNGLSAARREFGENLPQNHKARYELFLKMLDDLNDGHKADRIFLLGRDYSDAKKRVKVLSWLKPGNDDSCEWAWGYLLNFHESRIEAKNKTEGTNSYLGYEIATIPLLFWLEPHGEEDQQMAFYAALQTWRCSPAELTLFRTNISKAWRQRQLRRSDEVRPINTHISVESKKKLDALSRSYRLSLQKTLEAIIDKASSEIK